MKFRRRRHPRQHHVTDEKDPDTSGLKAYVEWDVQDVLSKLEQSGSRAELVHLCCKRLGFRAGELAALMTIETVAQLTEEADTVTSWSSLERLDDLADLAVLLILEGGFSPEQAGGWFRSRNRHLSWERPIYALGRHGYLHVLKAAEAACQVSGRPGEEVIVP